MNTRIGKYIRSVCLLRGSIILVVSTCCIYCSPLRPTNSQGHGFRGGPWPKGFIPSPPGSFLGFLSQCVVVWLCVVLCVSLCLCACVCAVVPVVRTTCYRVSRPYDVSWCVFRVSCCSPVGSRCLPAPMEACYVQRNIKYSAVVEGRPIAVEI